MKVRAPFKATSTAGLAADATWTQPTEPSVKRISGTFEGFNLFVGQRFDWYGTVTFTRDNPNDSGTSGTYTQSGGTATFTASGKDAGGHACQMRGSKQFGLPAGAGYGSVTGTPPDLGPPYTYLFAASLGVNPLNPASMNVELFSCVAPDEEYEGTSHTVVVNGFAPLQTGGPAADLAGRNRL